MNTQQLTEREGETVTSVRETDRQSRVTSGTGGSQQCEA